MPRSSDVDAWFKELDHPLKDAMLRVRSIILGSDRRVTDVPGEDVAGWTRTSSRATTPRE